MRLPARLAVVIVACAIVAACGEGGLAPSAVPSPSPAPTPPPAARYVVVFDATWHESTHAVPPNPHFSGLIGGKTIVTAGGPRGRRAPRVAWPRTSV